MNLWHHAHPLDFLPHGRRERRRQRRGLALGVLVLGTAMAAGFTSLHLTTAADARAVRRLAASKKLREQADAKLAEISHRAARIDPLIAQAAAWRASRTESVTGLLLTAVLPDVDHQPFTLDWTASTGTVASDSSIAGTLDIAHGGSSADWLKRLAKSSLIASTTVVDASTLHATIDATAATADRLLHESHVAGVADIAEEAR